MKSKWYLAYLIEYPVISHKITKKLIAFKKYLYWENLVLIKAKNPNLAYNKALKLGKEKEYKTINEDGDFLEWKFAGIYELVEIGESISDKEEITFTENFTKNYQQIKKLISPKNSLSAFQWNKKVKSEKLERLKNKKRN